MSEGELMQMEKSRSLNLDEQVYFEIIKQNSFPAGFGLCAGAWSASGDEEADEQMKAFGEKVGIAFQIKDDLFDYASGMWQAYRQRHQRKKADLPLIYTLNNVDKKTRRELIYIIKNEKR
jgi:octaprenyl-diphosphate synthase